MEEASVKDTPIYKLVNREWKTLPSKGDDVFIRDSSRMRDGQLGDLRKKSVLELEEILLRLDKTLANKYLVKRLKDQGERLRQNRQEVIKALEAARKREKAVHNQHQLTDLDKIEWKETRKTKPVLDSDDDTDDGSDLEEAQDPLRLMAYHSSSVKKPAARGSRMEDDDPAEAIVKELQQLALMDTNHNSAPIDFGSQRILKFKEMQRNKGPIRDAFKPFRPVSHQKAPSERSTICLPMEEAGREPEYIVKERQQIYLMNRKTSRKPRYHDTNLGEHLLDPAEEVEEEEDYTF